MRFSRHLNPSPNTAKEYYFPKPTESFRRACFFYPNMIYCNYQNPKNEKKGKPL